MNNVRKAILVTCIALGIALFLSFLALDPYYYSTRPREPHPESGRIYAENVKSANGAARVYLTRTEKLPYDYASWILTVYLALFITAYLLNQRWNVIWNPPQNKPRKF